jgi:hypothetical protein
MPVDFRVMDAERHELAREPIWGGTINTAELTYLVGRPVDGGRGQFTIPSKAR